MDEITDVIDPLLLETDKHKQRAGAEILVGMLRGVFPFEILKVQRPENRRIEALDHVLHEEVVVMDNSQIESYFVSNKARNNIVMGIGF